MSALRYTSFPVNPAHDEDNETLSRRISGVEAVLGKLSLVDRQALENDKVNASSTINAWIAEEFPKKLKGFIVDMLRTERASPYTTLLLPIVLTQHGGQFTWTEVRFQPEPMGNRDSFVPGRYEEHTSVTRYVRTEQKGAGLYLDLDFYMLKEGRLLMQYQVEHLAGSMLLRNDNDVLLALLNSYFTYTNALNRSNQLGKNCFYAHAIDLTMHERMLVERNMFSIVNKTPDSRGFQLAVTNIRDQMAVNGVTPDAIIVPPNLIKHFYGTKDDLVFNSMQGNEMNRETAIEIPTTTPVRARTFQGMQVIDEHVYRRDHPSPQASATALLTVTKQVGEYYPMALNMCFNAESFDFSTFKSTMRNVKIYNEEKDKFEEIAFSDAIRNSHRFDEDGMLHHTRHHAGLCDDMFMYTEYHHGHRRSAKCEVFGRMMEKSLSLETVEMVVKTMRTRFHKIINLSADEESSYNQAMDTYNDAAALGTALEIDEDGDPAHANHPVNTCARFSDIVNAIMRIGGDAFPSHISLPIDIETILKLSIDVDFAKANDMGYLERFVVDTYIRYTPLERALLMHFLTADICEQNFMAMHRTNTMIPVDIVLVRPFMTYAVSSAILMKAGSSTGCLFVSELDFQYSTQVEPRKIVGSFAYQSAACVQRYSNVVVAPHVMCQAYRAGSNCQFVTEKGLDYIATEGGIAHEADMDESLIAIMVPIMKKPEEHLYMDYRGRNKHFPKSLFHASADYYSSMFKIAESTIAEPADEPVDYVDCRYRYNTMCWIGSMQYGPDMRNTIHGKGHLGRAYEGVAMTREGTSLAPAKY